MQVDLELWLERWKRDGILEKVVLKNGSYFLIFDFLSWVCDFFKVVIRTLFYDIFSKNLLPIILHKKCTFISRRYQNTITSFRSNSNEFLYPRYDVCPEIVP